MTYRSHIALLSMLVACGGLVACGAGSAQDTTQSPGAGPQGHGRHREAPPEAFAVCEGKSAGEGCVVKFGDHEMTGTCESPPPQANDTRLSCRSSEPPPGGPPHGGPPHGGAPPGGPGR